MAKPRRKPITMRRALEDRQLLGNVLPGDSFRNWRIALIAANGEPLDADETECFKQFSGGKLPPTEPVDEFVAGIGRRGGKDKAASVEAAYRAGLCDFSSVLAPGEVPTLLCIAPDQRQAKIQLNYIHGAFESSPMMASLVHGRTADVLSLTNGVQIEVRAASFRRLRGMTAIGVIASEVAFWQPDEFSANPDQEILTAVRPALATTKGRLTMISSPYARRGVLYESYRQNFGPDGDPRVLVIQGSTIDFNPTFDPRIVERALEKDRAAASAEYLGQFRQDIEGFVPIEVVESCVGDHIELPKGPYQHRAFCDPSGGSGRDSFTLAIAHRSEDDKIVIDAIREVRPPFSPSQVIDDFTALLKSYRIDRVHGDRFAGEFPREQFRRHGIAYRLSEKVKSDLFRDLLPMLNSGRIVLSKSERLVNQLCGLERRTARSGKDSIDHAPGGHDDLANSVAGVADVIVAMERQVLSTPTFGTYAQHLQLGHVWYGSEERPHRLDGPCYVAGRDGMPHQGFARKI